MQKLLISFLLLHAMTIFTRNITPVNLCKHVPLSVFSKFELALKNESFYSEILKNNNKKELSLIKNLFEEYRETGEQIKKGCYAHYESNENGLKKHTYIDAASQINVDSLELGCLIDELCEKSKGGLFYFNKIIFKVTILYKKEGEKFQIYNPKASLTDEEIKQVEGIVKDVEQEGISFEKNIYTNLLRLIRDLDSVIKDRLTLEDEQKNDGNNRDR